MRFFEPKSAIESQRVSFVELSWAKKALNKNSPKDCYLGCFQDQFVRDLNADGIASRTMTIDRCRKFCSKYTYAALQNGYF